MKQKFSILDRVDKLTCSNHGIEASFVKLTGGDEQLQCAKKCKLSNDSIQISELEELLASHLSTNPAKEKDEGQDHAV